MKKPFILLVDDDPRVLEALENELAPAFSDICRLEPFEDPHDALAFVRDDARDGDIALAIVDQKMPGLSGVELLRQIREEAGESVAHLECVLLTGYAGLDSAVAAKNQVDVGRYLEKPWTSEGLVESCRALIGRFLASSTRGQYFVFRELSDAADVHSHFALRSSIYQRDRNVSSLISKGQGIDVDGHDVRSRLFGLFRHDASGASREMVGTMRLTGQEDTRTSESVRREAQDAGVLLADDLPVLPMLEYAPDRETLTRFVEKLARAGSEVVEPGRLALDSRYRSSRRGLSTHMIGSAAAYAFVVYEIPDVVLACRTSHQIFYVPLGFRETEGTHARFWEAVNCEAICLHGRLKNVPDDAMARLRSIAKRLHTPPPGGGCFCRSFPKCLPGQYETGNFSTCDLFCPIRAGEVLASDTETVEAHA